MTVQVFELRDGYGIDHLVPGRRERRSPGPGEVVVRMHAASLNYRDLATVKNGRFKLPLIPFSDGAGEVVAVGEGVTRVIPGDRVCPLFFQSWLAGGPSARNRARPLGGPLDGVLQAEMVLDAEGVARMPGHFDFAQAATLPCAGLTAWRALMVEGRLQPGQWVLVEGTGGVSVFALQFAKMAGAKVIATSASDAKLARATALGADATINYRATPAWGKAAAELTGGEGVDIVIEVGGPDTLPQALDATRIGGRVVIIGILSGLTAPIPLATVFSKNLHLDGISVGSREQFEAMVEAIIRARMEPVIDRTFPVAEVRDALRLMEAGGHFGKICLTF